MFSIAPLTVGRNPLAAKDKPSKAFNCDEQVLIAVAEVKPELTGDDIKFTINPVGI